MNLSPTPLRLGEGRVVSYNERKKLKLGFKASLRLPNGRLTPTGRGLEVGFFGICRTHVKLTPMFIVALERYSTTTNLKSTNYASVYKN